MQARFLSPEPSPNDSNIDRALRDSIIGSGVERSFQYVSLMTHHNFITRLKRDQLKTSKICPGKMYRRVIQTRSRSSKKVKLHKRKRTD